MIHIQRFVEKLQGFDARGSKDFSMSMRDAKDLHADITKLLLALQTNHADAPQDEVIEVQITGGKF
jgi:hypothetical protein